MNRIQELREKRSNTWNAAKAFLDSKRTEDGFVSAEDAAVYEKMESEIVNLGKQIDILERQKTLDLELSKPVGGAILNKPSAVGVKSTRTADDYKKAFWNAIRGKVNTEIQNALQIGTDTQGGYLVPDEFERTLVQALTKLNTIRRISKTISTSQGDRRIPIVASHGNASWVEEEGYILDSDDAFGQVYIGAHKLATMMKVSDELLNDSAFNIAEYIAEEFARRIGAAEEEAFVSGDGVGKPLGLLASTGGAELGIQAESVTTLQYDEIIDLYHSLRTPYRSKAMFVANDITLKAIRKLKDGNGQYIWQPSVTEGQPDSILGRSIESCDSMPVISSGAKVLLFGDFNYYWIADRTVRSLQRLNELYAATGHVGFIASERVDSKLILPEAIKFMQMAA